MLFATAAEWVARLAEAHAAGRLQDDLRRLGRYPLLVTEGTASRVDAFSTWLGTHKIQAVAALAAIVGLVLIVKGLTAL